MGWASGSSLADNVWKRLKKLIPPDNQRKAARILIEEFEGEDCDTLYECEDLVETAGTEWMANH